ncbi:MAG: hypothetical protein AB1578_10100 [Thermodesulfobacteriota bacterium]
MAATWTRDPASTEGPVTLEASQRGATLRVVERGNHWFASVTFPDGTQWSQACRTEEEAKTLALRAAEAPQE